MHPGPINRGVEIDSEIADSGRSVILDQVTNGLAVRMAVLFLINGGQGPQGVAAWRWGRSSSPISGWPSAARSAASAGFGCRARWPSASASDFPGAPLVVNFTGSFAIGLLAALTLPEGRLNTSRSLVSQLLMLGLCGGYTTFSSFSLHTLTLAREGQWLWAAGNVLISVAACLLAVWLGFLLGEGVNR